MADGHPARAMTPIDPRLSSVVLAVTRFTSTG